MDRLFAHHYVPKAYLWKTQPKNVLLYVYPAMLSPLLDTVSKGASETLKPMLIFLQLHVYIIVKLNQLHFLLTILLIFASGCVLLLRATLVILYLEIVFYSALKDITHKMGHQQENV